MHLGTDPADAVPMSILDKPRRKARAGPTRDGDARPSRVAATRDASNELYNHACDLLLAAEAVRAASAETAAAPGFAATLGCMEASLEALAHATAAMRRTTDAHVAGRGPAAPERFALAQEDAQREFCELIEALNAAHHAADQLRQRAGPLLAQMSEH
jgi:hypothetical protein